MISHLCDKGDVTGNDDNDNDSDDDDDDARLDEPKMMMVCKRPFKSG